MPCACDWIVRNIAMPCAADPLKNGFDSRMMEVLESPPIGVI